MKRLLTAMTMMLIGTNVAVADDPPRPAWQPVPIVTAAVRAAGFEPGGEGGQWYRDIQVSRSDPDFLVLAIDVGGIYRTRDGGRRWEPVNTGYNARGCNAVAIDPRNAQRVLAIGGNAIDWKAEWSRSPHGVYLSTDQAATWRQVLERLEGEGAAFAGSGGSIAFDPSSFDDARGFCTRAYFAPRDGGIFRSDDGGATWRQVSDRFGHARLHVDNAGALYVAGAHEKTTGLFRSDDRGATWAQLLAMPVHGLDVEHGRVYVSGGFGVQVSADGGKTFADLGSLSGLDRQNDKPVLNVTVSPADASRMAAWIQGDNWNWVRFVSHDGGKTWHESKWDNALAALPYNRRQGHWAFHPTDANVVYSIGGDWATRSTDGGRTFAWHANGYNGIMLGGLFNFSPASPDIVALFFQDYNGAITRDGGRTWTYLNVSGKGWGGYCYGGYTPDGTVLFGGDAPSWYGPRQLRVSLDAGQTWRLATDAAGKPIVFAGPDVAYSDPRNADVCFASNWRSDDRGRTWQPMSGCDGVFTSSPAADHALLGRRDKLAVKSTDGGATWTPVTGEAPAKITDVAYDPKLDRVFAACDWKLFASDAGGPWREVATPRDQFGGVRVMTVCVDPADPSVVYAGGPAHTYMSSATIARSTDAGRTWTNLTTGTGPHEVQAVRVHPVTREAWVNGQCFGMWKIGPPGK